MEKLAKGAFFMEEFGVEDNQKKKKKNRKKIPCVMKFGIFLHSLFFWSIFSLFFFLVFTLKFGRYCRFYWFFFFQISYLPIFFYWKLGFFVAEISGCSLFLWAQGTKVNNDKARRIEALSWIQVVGGVQDRGAS